MTSLPTVEHIYQHHHLDSTRWSYFTPRRGDIVISTSYKAGTTFMQTIVGNLLYPDDDAPEPLTHLSPWIDMRTVPLELILGRLDSQTTRRFIKTHLPLDGLPYNPEMQYIMVGRDPRDVFMSLLNHWGGHTDEFIERINGVIGRKGDPFPKYHGDIKRAWTDWMTRGCFDWERDGYPMWSHLHHCETWWRYRDLPNIKLVHYSDLLADLDGQMRDIAAYLDITLTDAQWPGAIDRCTFSTVKKDPEKVVGNMDGGFKGGAQAFIYKGTNNRWQGVLDDDDLELYDAAAMARLPADCAHWLQNGWLA
ncbi:MAG: sulfotransferase domain-containing protein [Alphaproteobacteria bacterium]